MTTITTTWGETYKGVISMRCQDDTAFLIDIVGGGQRIVYDSKIVSMNFIF